MVRGVRAPDGALSLRRSYLAALALLCAVLHVVPGASPAAPAAAATQHYSAVYTFGDSLSDTGNAWIDSGNVTPPSPPYMGGRYSNGAIWVEDIAHAQGIALPAPRLAGGTGYAFAGAKTAGGTQQLENLPGQLVMFAADVANVAPAGALYTISIGGNDLRDAVAGGMTGSALTAFAQQTAQTTVAATVTARDGPHPIFELLSRGA